MGLLERFFGGFAAEAASRRDGEAHALEAHATGIPDARLDPDAPRPAEESPAIGRRGRPLTPARDILVEGVAQKVLHGWMQNRHQTLYPLSVNLRTLEPGKGRLLARLMAAMLLAGSRMPDEGRVASTAAWFREAGGASDLEGALRAAFDEPEPLSALLAEIQDAKLSAYAYVVALIAADLRNEADHLFLDYLAVRLALPANVVRSADKKYRRSVV